MQIKVEASSDSARVSTGIGPGLWLITVMMELSVTAPAIGVDPYTGKIEMKGTPAAGTYFWSADPGTTSDSPKQEVLFAYLTLITSPDVTVECTVNDPAASASGAAYICAERLA